jgi:hypothetical protein
MLLALGHPDDPLIQHVYRRAADDGLPIHCIDESDLFASTSFAYEQNGTSSTGHLSITETGSREAATLPLNQLTGVLVRLPRLWWPSTSLDLQDQMFVYHESSAAWFALLEGLSCPVVNRFDLAWWLNDTTYPGTLTHNLAHQLKIPTSTSLLSATPPPRILPTAADPNCSSVYLAGATLISKSPHDRTLSLWLTENLPTLTAWQHESGVQLARLDFDRNPDDPASLCLHHAEIFPWLEDESPALIDQIAAATVEMLT